MDFKQIQYFLCLFEEGSITRAANRLNIVQPALSMQLSRLEKEIGQKLFTRTVVGITPTAAGRFMRDQFLPIMRDIAQAQAKTASLAGKLYGKVEIGMLSSVASTVLAAATHNFLVKYPDVEIVVKEGYSAILMESVMSGQLDAAIVNRIAEPSGIVVNPIIDERLCVIVGAGSKFHPKRPVSLAQISKMNLIVPTSENGLRSLIDRQAQAQGIHLKPRVALDGLIPIIDLVQRYDGVTLLPPLSASSGLRSGALRALPLARPNMNRSLIWVHHSRRPMTPATRRFIDVVNEEIKRAIAALQGIGDKQKMAATLRAGRTAAVTAANAGSGRRRRRDYAL
jgi:LysR family nitrogen assimilation transcriptional regulator